MGGQWKHSSATTIICQCHKKASLNNSSGEIKSTERQSKWRKFKWRVNENMQGKDVLASNKINVFTVTWLPLLRIPFSADHSMDITKNTFWGARTLVGPNLVHKRRQKSMFKMTLPWKGVSLIWKGPIAYLVSLTISIDFHKPMSVPYSTCLILPGFCGGSHIFLDNSIFYDYIFNVQCPSIFLWPNSSHWIATQVGTEFTPRRSGGFFQWSQTVILAVWT